MGGIDRQLNIGAYLKGSLALLSSQIIAGDANDGLEQIGSWVGRFNLMSAVLLIPYKVTLAKDETLSFDISFEDADDQSGTNAAPIGGTFSGFVETGDIGGSIIEKAHQFNLNLSSARGFIRCKVTPTLSAPSADSIDMSAIYALSGQNNYPVKASN